MDKEVATSEARVTKLKTILWKGLIYLLGLSSPFILMIGGHFCEGFVGKETLYRYFFKEVISNCEIPYTYILELLSWIPIFFLSSILNSFFLSFSSSRSFWKWLTLFSQLIPLIFLIILIELLNFQKEEIERYVKVFGNDFHVGVYFVLLCIGAGFCSYFSMTNPLSCISWLKKSR